MLDEFSRVYAKIDLDALSQNVENMYNSLPRNTKMLAVVKADGYGFGAVPISRMLQNNAYIWGFATATAEEAFELRENGISKPIVVLGYTFPYAYERMLRENIRPTVFRYDMLKHLSERVKKRRAQGGNEIFHVHVAVDCGMSRIGVRTDADGENFIKTALATEGIEVEGLFTHFARADEADLTNAHSRFKEFEEFVRKVEADNDFKIPIVHCANSASIIDMPEAHMDMVRCGVTMYGMWPSEEVSRNKIEIKPVMSMYSHISFIKDIPENTSVSYGGTFVSDRRMRVATIPVGYGDGYPRSLSGGRGYVLVHGVKARILGRVCMDQFMVDVSGIPNAKEGDEVILIGQAQAVYGDSEPEKITIEELGDLSGRFNYEFTCDINHRVPRLYSMDGKILKAFEV
ncbi:MULTISPECIES: alanine racemase [unclassified Butyrivibrio]|jgi:alanine racemase|uniref:alanine racemase n=1 Tax=unclassified Butyrivibrio TaxID=2639466 RepID=UPI000419FA95|nr:MULTISPECIES: alanine racemase [unclassified Butyrivibrio]